MRTRSEIFRGANGGGRHPSPGAWGPPPSLTSPLEWARPRMKVCSYCRRENPDESKGCRERGTEAFADAPAEQPSHSRKRGSLRRRAKNLYWRVNRSYRIGSIAMLPAGLILLGSAVVELASGNYRIGHNRYGDPVGPLSRAVFGFAFSCAGGVLLWYYLRRPKPPGPRDGKPPF